MLKKTNFQAQFDFDMDIDDLMGLEGETIHLDCKVKIHVPGTSAHQYGVCSGCGADWDQEIFHYGCDDCDAEYNRWLERQR